MSVRLSFENAAGNPEAVSGSDKRLNTSARVDDRRFYRSRDAKQLYEVMLQDDDAAAGDIIGYLKNTHASDHLFLTLCETTSDNTAKITVSFGNDTAIIGGSAVTPTNMFGGASEAAPVVAQGVTAITGVGADKLIRSKRGLASTPIAMEWHGLIIPPSKNIIVVLEEAGGTGDISVLLEFYMDNLT